MDTRTQSQNQVLRKSLDTPQNPLECTVSMRQFVNIAGYKFVPLANLKPLRSHLLERCRTWNLRGTILLSGEGINLFVAGLQREIDLLLVEIRSIPGLEEFGVKYSESDSLPFRRMLVRIKKEIIAFGVEDINPARHTSPKLPARTLKQWLDEGRPMTLLDTRNGYEVKLGTFRNAKHLDIEHFRDFPNAVKQLPESMKEKPVVMFCTGGIRCEKAGPFMEKQGFQVYQLDGGILKYFEECGGAHYDGECFVFDQRVGVDASLQETDSAQCFRCQSPLTASEQADARYVPGVSCPYCFLPSEERTASLLADRHRVLRDFVNPLPGSTPEDNHRPVQVPGDCDGFSLMEMLGRVIRSHSLEEWEEICRRGDVLDSAGNSVSPTKPVRAGERYRHRTLQVVEPAVNVDIRILHEDEALVVVNKPAPLPMHPSGRFHRNTLQSILNHVYKPQRLHPAHRLDANTTGLVIFARTQHVASRLQPQFAEGKVEKEYLVRVIGTPESDTFRCDIPITAHSGPVGLRDVLVVPDGWDVHPGGLAASTLFEVLARQNDGTALLRARPLTGRTNQIRVHLWHLRIPVVGDPAYLPDKKLGTRQTLELEEPPLCLHAWRLKFTHPLDQQPRTYEAGVPDWADKLEHGEILTRVTGS